MLGMEIVDELDGAADMQQLARRSWERRARVLGLIEDPPDSDRDAPGDSPANRRTGEV